MLNRRNKSPLSHPDDVESLLEEKKLLNLSPNNSKRTRRFDQCRPVILLAIGAAIVLLLLFLFLPYPSPPYTKPKSKYPADTRISVVVMNHSRPRMIRESLLMKTLTEHDAVTEILLCHSNPLTKFTFDHVKVKNIDAVQANEEHGLSLRFWYCRQAQHQFVLHIDDDMELSPHALDDLLSEFTLNTHRIVGKYGRSYSYWRNLPRSGYDAATLGGPVEVVLTKILLLERSMCDAFFRHAHLVEQDVMKESRPLWNGEDIFVNLVANHEYNVPINGPYNNFAIKDLDVWEASDSFKDDDTGEHDVSGNMDRHRPWNVGWAPWLKAYRRSQAHAAFRGRLWYIAKQRLAQQK